MVCIIMVNKKNEKHIHQKLFLFLYIDKKNVKAECRVEIEAPDKDNAIEKFKEIFKQTIILSIKEIPETQAFLIST